MLQHPFQVLLKNRIPIKFISYLLVCVDILFFSCEKESITANIIIHQLDNPLELHGIHFYNSNEAIIIGGDTWSSGYLWTTHDAGISWLSEKIVGAEIFNFYSKQINDIWVCGPNFCQHRKDNQSRTYLPKAFNFYRSVLNYNLEKQFLVFGEAFKYGGIDVIDSGGEITNILATEHEMEKIVQIDSQKLMAIGYGTILISTDGGITWNPLSIAGDHYIDAQFINSKMGFVIGHFGSILATNDGGNHFKALRDGSSPFVKDEPFRAILFKNELEGIIVGDFGLIWTTKDGAQHWTKLHGQPNENYLSASWDGNSYWVCGSNGSLISFKL